MKIRSVFPAVRALTGLALILLNTTNLVSQVTVSEQDWVLPTYPVNPPDKNPMFFKGESYQGASRYVYPYGLNDVISEEKIDKAWKALILENEYIKLCVTPEIGGKLYYATDKSNNYNFIYKNNVVKPSNIGMLGAWVSGGIEWCVLHHHRASTFLPVDYTITENSDGSKTIRIGETEPRQRMRWTIAITAFPGKSYFMAEVKILNPTPFTHSFLYWANVAAHTNKDYQVIFPPSVQFATYHAKNSFTRWPFSTQVYNRYDFTEGVDVSWWKNSPNSNSFFAWDLKEDFMGGYDHGKQTGTVHIGDHNVVKGAKLWEWGSGPRGQATEGRLTENDGPYVEIMTGAFSDNQPDYSWIRPYEVKTFKQFWYPVKDIEGFKNANLNGAVNLEARDNSQVLLGYYSTCSISKATIVLKKNGETIFKKDLSISPEKAFRQLIKLDSPFELTDLYTEMSNSETGEILVSYKPLKPKPEEELPETVKRPDLPKDIATTEELYLTGSRIDQFGNPTLNALDYYEEALKRDPFDIRTNTAMGTICLKNGDFIKARSYFGKAIKRLAKDYTRPSDCEAFYLQGLTLRALGLYDEAIDTLHRATWDYAWYSAAYLELARISSLKGNIVKALQEVEESLSTDSRNNSAINLKASLLRVNGDFARVAEVLEPLLVNDPLDFRAANESYLSAKAMGELPRAEKELTALNVKMRDFNQNYLELAAGYMNDGLLSEAADILMRFKGDDPEISYYLGYLADRKGNKQEAAKYFSEGSAQSVDYCFPFRLETVNVLETALKYKPDDSRAFYYLGNILYDKQPEKAIGFWEQAVKYEPGLAIAHRNLGWGYFQHQGDGLKAIAAYEKAMALKKDEPVYYEELDALYEMSNAPVDRRLKMFEGNNETVSKRDDAFARQLTVLTLAGKPDEAVKYLTGRKFSYREGDSRVREVIIDAHLMLGKKYFADKNYSKALEEFLLAQVPEEEAGESRTGNRNIQVDYFIGLSYEALGNRSKAKSFFTLSTGRDSRSISYIKYYQALSFSKLGKKKEATGIFNSLISEGDRLLGQSSSKDIDFFAKFGEQEAENARMSNAYLIKGLGYKGLGNTDASTENLRKAVELSAGNLYANMELKGL
jgi:tetratricopeptide (TPR) repeat protein